MVECLYFTHKTMWFRKDFWNRLWNTVCVAPRAVWTWLSTVSDATRTALYWVLDPFEWLGKTAWDIKDAIHKSFTEWKWYQKLWKAPASLVATPFMAVEWVAETLWHTWCNLFRNVRDTIAHPFINVGHSVKWMWSTQKIWDFKLEKIEERSKMSPKNRVASLFK